MTKECEATTTNPKRRSVLNFLLCMDQDIGKDHEESDDEDEKMGAQNVDNIQVKTSEFYGHGFAIAGSVIMYLLGQTTKFKMLDFSYYVLKVSEMESENLKGGGERGGVGGGESTWD